jgi:hypothetical protein
MGASGGGEVLSHTEAGIVAVAEASRDASCFAALTAGSVVAVVMNSRADFVGFSSGIAASVFGGGGSVTWCQYGQNLVAQ